MSLQIKFDVTNTPEKPTIILAKNNGDIIGKLDGKAIEVADNLNEPSEFAFTIYKYLDNHKTPWWDDITDFKLVHCLEWDMWFQIKIELEESSETIKTISCTQLGQAELAQIKLFNIQINTEEDIAREDYELPTIFYDPENKEASLLHRILEKAPHYQITYVDASLMKIQKTFSWDNKSIYDVLQEIAKEVQCIFIFPSNSDSNGNIQRTIEVYDLLTYCNECGYRGEFDDKCTECNSTDVKHGYGEDTTIFVTADKLAEELQLSGDKDSVKNCFKLVAGDDLMTATIKSCNPNGSDYLWHISDMLKTEMSNELVRKIEEYDSLYRYYNKEFVAEINLPILINYNTVVDKYSVFNPDLEKVSIPIVGFPDLIQAYYNTIDMTLFLQNSLMPTYKMADTNAEKEAEKITIDNISSVAVSDIDKLSLSSANNAVLSMVKILVDSRYKVKVEDSALSSETNIWTGYFSIENYSDEEDYATSKRISIEINGDYEMFVKQKIEKALQAGDVEDVSISGLFKKDIESFKTELTKYSLSYLNMFHDSCQGCIDILIEQGISDKSTWANEDSSLYDNLYLPYLEKLSVIENEMKVREDEINSIIGIYNADGELIQKGLQTLILDIRNKIQDLLNFEKFLGKTLWLEFCIFRREDKYSNTNYISDGLNNAELIANALDFLEAANRDIRKSSNLQYQISSTLKNLLVIPEFKPLVKHFKVGNWIRVQIDDEIYKLRLIHFSFEYDDISQIEVEFSDITNIKSSATEVQKILEMASSMATSYESVKRQAKQGEEGNRIIEDIVDGGLSASNVAMMNNSENQNQSWNERGMLFREYDTIIEEYSDTQLKIINSTIAVTDDKWVSTKTALGKIYYKDPITGLMKQAFGFNGELIVGKLLLGESLGIYNAAGNLTFDDNGLVVTNHINTVTINPNSHSIFNIRNKTNDLFTFDENGDMVIVGNITAKSLILNEGVTIGADKVTGLSTVAISGKYGDLLEIPEFSDVAYSGLYQDLIDIPEFSNVAYSGEYEDLNNKPILATVALSGAYDDLIGKPVLSDVAISGQYSDLIGVPENIANLEAYEERISTNTSGVETNAANIESLNKLVNDNLNSILDLQSRVSGTEADIEALSIADSSLDGKITVNSNNITALQKEIETLKEQIASMT